MGPQTQLLAAALERCNSLQTHYLMCLLTGKNRAKKKVSRTKLQMSCPGLHVWGLSSKGLGKWSKKISIFNHKLPFFWVFCLGGVCVLVWFGVLFFSASVFGLSFFLTRDVLLWSNLANYFCWPAVSCLARNIGFSGGITFFFSLLLITDHCINCAGVL